MLAWPWRPGRDGVVASFEPQGEAGGDEEDLVGGGGDGLVEAAGGVAEAAGEGVFGDDAEADLVRDGEPGAAGGGEGGGEAVGLGLGVGAGEEEVA